MTHPKLADFFIIVSLDPVYFQNLNKLFDNPNLVTLTQEIFLYNFINQNKDKQFTDFENLLF